MHTIAQIEHLEEVLDSLKNMPDAMFVSELDGFVAGLLLCPDRISPSEWLPDVWGTDGKPAFDSIEQAREATDAVIAHYNRVANNFANRTDPYQTVLEYEEGEDEPYWEFWIEGFYKAMTLRPDAWSEYFYTDDDIVKVSFAFMTSLIDIVIGESKLPKKSQDELTMVAADAIPKIVTALNNWLKEYQRMDGQSPGTYDWLSRSDQNIIPFRTSKVGRNETCPCGSGRKYKKCCGAN